MKILKDTATKRATLVLQFALWGFSFGIQTGSAASLVVDCAENIGSIRPLHGGNCGPIQYGEMLDLSEQFRELGIPFIRLHDCHWPNPDVVDIHAIYRNSEADPKKQENYDFRRTDDYLQAIVDVGSQIVYRLGESIEHTKRKFHVHPPKDAQQWAAICIGIIRHYNEGWANGYRHDIRYWEIWNEPENKPAMWTGSDGQYFHLYGVTAQAIKSRWPDLKVGGPSLGYTGKMDSERFLPGDYLLRFLAHCRDRKLPLDFFSWHLYTADPYECVRRARGLRRILDQHGFNETELHFNEWNYLPNNDWAPMMLQGQGRARAVWFTQVHGAAGAAFTACVLANLQNSPVDVANYYSMTHHGFGLFNPHGIPHKPFYAVKAFRLLLNTPLRVKTEGGNVNKLTLLAGLNAERSKLGVLVSNLGLSHEPVQLRLANLPWSGGSRFELHTVDAIRELTEVRRGELPGELDLSADLKAPAVGLLRIFPAERR